MVVSDADLPEGELDAFVIYLCLVYHEARKSDT
jgi:hypothetical protein